MEKDHGWQPTGQTRAASKEDLGRGTDHAGLLPQPLPK